MDRGYLILSIVLDTVVTNLSKEDTKNLLFTNKYASTNEHIIRMRNKYTVIHYYELLKGIVISLVFAKDKKDLSKINSCEEEKQKICDTVYGSNETIRGCFALLMVAEYKEYVYNSMFDSDFDEVEDAIMLEYEAIVEGNGAFFMSKQHVHDPSHYMFTDVEYSFYEMYEIKGFNILDDWDCEFSDEDGDLFEAI